MIRKSWAAMSMAALLAATAPALVRSDAVAQNPPRTLDIGGPPGDSAVKRCYTDSIVTAALDAFNGPAAVHVFGGGVHIQRADTITGSYDVYRGSLRIDGRVHGNVIVLNGDALIRSTGAVLGSITVLGGHLTVDPGAEVSGHQFQCDEPISFTRLADGTVTAQPPGRSLGNLASGIALNAGQVRLTPHAGIGQYNRVEALPIELGAAAAWAATPRDSLLANGYGIVRTGRDPSGSRATVGWHLQAVLKHDGPLPLTIGVEGGSTVQATLDRPYPAVESGLSAFFLRRDYADWFLRRGGSVFASIRPLRELTLSGAVDISRETTLLAIDALSLLRSNEAWRPNPLIDDGKYQTLSLRATLDGRNEVAHPVLQWYGNVEVRRVTSNDLTPVSLPTTIRNALRTGGYGETEGDFDLRGYLRLDPEQRINARISGGGYLAGDPLTIQSRRALGGVGPMSGYNFRAINCDRRRQADPANPALCDREMALQVEYRRVLPLDVGTRVGNYNIGIHKPELVVFGDAGSAWLAGDSAGRVPANRIQSLGEWKSDVGAGLSTRVFGLYIAKSLVDAVPLQLFLLFNRRF